jgi:Flp pilus assembly protein TadD
MVLLFSMPHCQKRFGQAQATKLLQLVAIVIGLVPLFCCAGCSKTVRSYNQFSGDGSHQMDQSPSASSKKDELMKRDPDELISMGYTYLIQGNESVAALHFTAALEKKPESAAAYAGLGEVDLRKNILNKALFDYSQAIKFDPKNRIALLGLGRLHRQSDDLVKSAQYFEEANAAYPNDCDIISELASTYDLIPQKEKAEALYRQAITLDKRRASSYNNLGYNLLLQGRYEEATQSLQQALSLEPDNKRAQNNLAAAYILAGQVDKAMPYMEQTVGQAAAHNNLGYIYMSRGEWDKAEREFREAMALKPSYYKLANQNLELLKEKRLAQQQKQQQPAQEPLGASR